MKYGYIYEPEAFIEYNDALMWYLERSVAAAENFANTIEEKLVDICIDPTVYRNPKKNYREISLKNYPYSIIYVIDEERNTVVITSVFHHRRAPKRKYKM